MLNAGAAAAGAGLASSEGAEPYLRVFSGCQSEGILAVKWHDTMPPLPGLLVSVATLYIYIYNLYHTAAFS